MSFRLVIDDAIVDAAALFAPFGHTIVVSGKDIPQYANQADGLIIRSRTKVDAALLQQNPQLQFIGSTVVGLDHIDQTACQEHNVHFYSAQGCNARSVAEYVINQIVSYAIRHQRTLSELTLAIIGVGHVGRQVEQLATTLGVNILLNDPPRAAQEAGFQHTPLHDCLAQADIITLHTPLTQNGNYPTLHLLSTPQIKLLPTGSLLINAARGDIVDESALLTRADIELITDCWHDEPRINESLLARSLLATPHIAGHAWDAKYRGGLMVRQALATWLNIALPKPKASLVSPLPLKPNDNLTNNPLLQLRHLLTQAYDFQQDHHQLRGLSGDRLHQQFEAYRRNYPIRREWTAHSIHTDNLAEDAISILVGLGFQLSS
jgi:erythronate-4-phosphate dehydrogenase